MANHLGRNPFKNAPKKQKNGNSKASHASHKASSASIHHSGKSKSKRCSVVSSIEWLVVDLPANAVMASLRAVFWARELLSRP